jgi:hypothetical protein
MFEHAKEGVMYCPNCGSETIADKKFCRSCGMDLQVILQAMNGELQPPSLAAAPAKSQRRQMMKYGFIALWAGLLFGVLLTILSDALIPLGPGLSSFLSNLAPLGGLVFVFGIGMMIYSRFLPKTPAIQPPANTNPITSSPVAQLPAEPFRQPIGSVTETTTRFLDETNPASTARNTASQ